MRYSIVIPVFNSEMYLCECIDSVLSQEYDDYEIVLVDDGSTDSSGLICEEYVAEHPNRIALLRQENTGPLVARQNGIRYSSGDVVMTLDSDDRLRSDALRKIDDAFEEYGVDIVLFALSRREDFSMSGVEPPFNESMLFDHSSIGDLRYRVCSSETLNSLVLKAIKRDFVDSNVDYSCYSGLNYGEDLLQFLAILDNVTSAYYLHDALYYYRVNYGSLSKSFNKNQAAWISTVRSIQMNYAKKWAYLHNMPSIIIGFESLCITSFAELAQAAAESLAISNAAHTIQNLASHTLFVDAYSNDFARNNVRKDFRLISFLMKRNAPILVILLSRIKGAIRRLLGR